MKIKDVCDLTGLTSRTIRVYIDECLIKPEYTENYLGRRAFNFSENDVDTLKNIAILRKYGFSIPEILKIQESEENSIEIISNLCQRKRKTIADEQNALMHLIKLNDSQSHSIEEIAETLNDIVCDYPIPAQDERINILKLLKHVLLNPIYAIIAFLPLLGCLLCLLLPPRTAYPTFNFKNFICIVITFIPLIIITCLHFLKREEKRFKFIKEIALVLAILCLPISCICSLNVHGPSITENIKNYRKLDADCLANNSMFYQELFPSWPRYFTTEKDENGEWVTTYLDSKYYYRYLVGFDYTYDIYAEWPLEKDDFDKEVLRVQNLYSEYSTDGCIYETIKKGDYVCLFRYYSKYSTPFEAVNDNYSYWIFAYNEENLRVRYIYCDSLENGVDQPYYLSLEW